VYQRAFYDRAAAPLPAENDSFPAPQLGGEGQQEHGGRHGDGAGEHEEARRRELADED